MRIGELFIGSEIVAQAQSLKCTLGRYQVWILPPPMYRSRVIGLVLNWTKDVLNSPSNQKTSVQISIRTSHPQQNPISDEAPQTVETAYKTVLSGPDVVPAAVSLANAICDTVLKEVHNLSVSEINTVAPEAGLVAGVNSLLTVLVKEFGYAPAVLRSFPWASAVTRWGMAAVPVASSLDQFIYDTCMVAEASPRSPMPSRTCC